MLPAKSTTFTIRAALYVVVNNKDECDVEWADVVFKEAVVMDRGLRHRRVALAAVLTCIAASVFAQPWSPRDDRRVVRQPPPPSLFPPQPGQRPEFERIPRRQLAQPPRGPMPPPARV